MRRITGIIIIVYSVLLAIGCLTEIKEDMSASLIGLFGFSLPLYIVGQFIRTNKKELKEKGMKWLAIYVF